MKYKTFIKFLIFESINILPLKNLIHKIDHKLKKTILEIRNIMGV